MNHMIWTAIGGVLLVIAVNMLGDTWRDRARGYPRTKTDHAISFVVGLIIGTATLGLFALIGGAT